MGPCVRRDDGSSLSFIRSSLFHHDVIRIVAAFLQATSDVVMITRRHVLGALAGAAILPSRGFANVAPQRSEIRPDLAKRFTDAGTVGTFVGYKVDDYLVIASDKDRSGEAKLPASTFKIPNSLIALETGVVGDPDKDVFKWDGVIRSIEAWNRDHTLRSAIAASAVPVYQEIARRIGAERMQKYVDLLEYGNRDIGGGIDQFWLTGQLADRSDPADRFRRPPAARRACRSPNAARNWCAISSRSRKSGDSIIRAKSGLLGAEVGKPTLGWLVGWAEKGSASTVFALNLDVREPRHIADRMKSDASVPRRYRRDLIGDMHPRAGWRGKRGWTSISGPRRNARRKS